MLHLRLLQLPYFWDEAGYYIPAARDILLDGSAIPHSTVSNAHPPLVMAWVALWWKIAGYAPVVSRSSMLFLSSFALLGVFRLTQRIANIQVAVASTVCTALYAVFFVQSSLVQVDLAAAGLVFWALTAYCNGEMIAAAVWFSLAALAKETSILAPVALASWEWIGWAARKSAMRELWLDEIRPKSSRRINRILALLVPTLPLAFWYAYHYNKTGHVFGNPEFFRYNVASTLNPVRFLLALAMRLWQVTGYLHLWTLTLPALLSMWLLPPQPDHTTVRNRIAIPVQMVFYVVVLSYVVAMSVIGGAVLARYMLPAIPLIIIVCVSTLWRRLRHWRAAVAWVALAFIAGWFWNPSYGFSLEDNLAYRNYLQLHEDGERFLEARYPMAQVLTAWPASDEITRPWLGFVTRPMHVLRIEDFSFDEVSSAAAFRGNQRDSNYEAALIFSTKYQPPPARWDRWYRWTGWKTRFFGFHRDLPPETAAQILGGHIVFSERRQGQWIAVIEIERNEIQSAEGRWCDLGATKSLETQELTFGDKLICTL